MLKHRFCWLPLILLLLGALPVWPFRRELTAAAIVSRSPGHGLLAAVFLIGLYALKSLSMAFPLSVLTAAGGLLFPFPAALAVNLAGVAAAQLVPSWLGRRQQDSLAELTVRHPKLASLGPVEPGRSGRTVFLLRLAGASPGDLVSLYLGAAGVPLGAYAVGLLGSLPRVASATLLGSSLWQPGSQRFWASLGLGAAMTVLSAALWRLWRRP